jgi:hypothetical protein
MGDPLHLQCQQKVAERIRLLALPGLSDQRVYQQLAKYDVNVVYPCVEVTIEKLSEKVEIFNVDYLLVKYPVQVLSLHRGDVVDSREAVPHFTWRDAMIPAFSYVRLGLPGELRATCEPGELLAPKGPAWLRVAGGLVVWCWITRKRTPNAA